MTFIAGDTLAGYPDSSDGNPALPTTLPGSPGGDRGRADEVGWGCSWITGSSPLLCQKLPCQPGFHGLWLEESVAISGERMAACGGGGWWQNEPQHHFRSEGSSAGTHTEGHKLSSSLHPTLTLSQISPCFHSLPTSSNKISFSHEFGPLLAPTQADRVPACHPFPPTRSLAWPPQPAGPLHIAPCPNTQHGPDVRAGTTQRSLLGSGGAVQGARGKRA